jgi:4-amino-4-deoxy-L-arabinose transferase and related glycosyltransferases of PMT family
MHSATGSSNKISVAIGLITVIILLLTTGGIGVTWDEPVYIASSNSYAAWYQQLISDPVGAMRPEAITKAWEVTHEHPPLVRIYSGLIWSVARHLTDDLTAHRLGNILLVGVMAALLYKMVAEETNRWAGIASIVALFTMPRFFFHAHLIELDMPVAAMSVIVAYIFWRTKESPRLRYSVLLGVAWGMALSIKFTSIFILPTLLLWVLMIRRKDYLLFRVLLAGAVAIPVFFVLWPWLYYDTASRLIEYLLFPFLAHWINREFYLGWIYTSTPWHYPFVMIAAVVPLGATLLYLAGIARSAISRRLRPFGLFLLFNALAPLLIQASGRFTAFDGERFSMAAFPFLAALAGIGFAGLAQLVRVLLRTLRAPTLSSAVTAAIGILLVLSPILDTTRLYPHLLSYYSEQVGGLPGAVELGLEPTYWCDTYIEAVRFINEHAKPGDSVWAEGSSFRVFLYYQLIGVLRSDVLLAVPPNSTSIFGPDQPFPAVAEDYTRANIVVVQNHKILFYDNNTEPNDFSAWTAQRKPVREWTLDGVTVLSIYENP